MGLEDNGRAYQNGLSGHGSVGLGYTSLGETISHLDGEAQSKRNQSAINAASGGNDFGGGALIILFEPALIIWAVVQDNNFSPMEFVFLSIGIIVGYFAILLVWKPFIWISMFLLLLFAFALIYADRLHLPIYPKSFSNLSPLGYIIVLWTLGKRTVISKVKGWFNLSRFVLATCICASAAAAIASPDMLSFLYSQTQEGKAKAKLAAECPRFNGLAIYKARSFNTAGMTIRSIRYRGRLGVSANPYITGPDYDEGYVKYGKLPYDVIGSCGGGVVTIRDEFGREMHTLGSNLAWLPEQPSVEGLGIHNSYEPIPVPTLNPRSYSNIVNWCQDR